MFSLKTTPVVVFFLFLASGIQTTYAENGKRGTIPALLRSAHQGSGLSRRASCGIGFSACEDGYGCCPIAQYCGEWDGILGCCPIGFTCGHSNDDSHCGKPGYVKCAGDDFCCPAGGLCSRNSNDQPRCYDADGAPAPVAGTVSSTHTSTKTSTLTTTTSAFFTTTTSSSSTTVTTFSFKSLTDDTPTSTATIPKITVTGTSSIAMATGGGGANVPGLVPNDATTVIRSASAAALFACMMTTLLAQ